MRKRIETKTLFSLLVIILFINLPLVSALQFSNVQSSVTANSAEITWETDQVADSFVSYGEEKNDLIKKGNADLLTQHNINLQSLQPQTTYFFQVESNNEIDNNNGNLYSFTTLAEDKTAPSLTVELPEFVKGNKFSLEGSAENNAEVKLFVNDALVGSTRATEGKFTFANIFLVSDQVNVIKIMAADSAGNAAEFVGQVVSDTLKPRITLDEVPSLITENLVLRGSVSENISGVIFVNNRSLSQFIGDSFEQSVSLSEGFNLVKVEVTDQAGWVSSEEVEVTYDTLPPTVSFQLEAGTEFYEGRAETDITGETEPGANLYLYVFREGVQQSRPFSRAVAKVKADDEGNFRFKDVTFPPPIFSGLKELAPREVPPGLEDILISPIGAIGGQDRKTYRVYVIAEDRTGKTAYYQTTVNVNSCFSGNFAFDVNTHESFPPQPLRLDPNLVEEGRETITAVFTVDYTGSAVGPLDPATNEVKPGYEVRDVRFEKACTQATAETSEYGLGCKLLNNIQVQPNSNKSVYVISSNLARADEFLEKDKSLWKDFQKRQLKFPLKILVSYREREQDGGFGPVKTQAACHDLGYFVDRLIDSEDLVPDVLIEQGLPAIEFTIDQIEKVKPYLETAVFVAGVSCFSSYLVKGVTKIYRIFTSKYEGLTSECPLNQNDLYLRETVESWRKDLPPGTYPAVPEEKILDEVCPSTAKAWETESYLDQLYRFTCDRFFCREVPARWTEDKLEEDINSVILEQQQCSVSTSGVALKEIENCQEEFQLNPANGQLVQRLREKRVDTCYSDGETLYYVDPDRKQIVNEKISRLKPVENLLPLGIVPKTDLLAHKPENSEKFIVGRDVSCEQRCKEKSGYVAASDGHSNIGPGCYKETVDGLEGADGARVDGNKVRGGYTNECFIDKNNLNDIYQCVCDKPKEATPAQAGVRKAVNQESVIEEWQYRQALMFQETRGRAGTLYPKNKYYDARDFSGAFGLNYGLDNFLEPKKTAQINPHSQYLGAWQSMCLPVIHGQLTVFQSMLLAFRNCLVEAKFTGLQDAGTCKALFTEQFCGLVYKGISSLFNQCSPLDLDDVHEEGQLEGVEAAYQSFRQAVPQALESSSNELKADYGASAEQYFSTGLQGITQSICLAAIGYDFNLDMDFIRDAAYSVPFKTDAYFPVANRELRSYDPIKGTASFDYNLGGIVVPGCKVRSYKTQLKCISFEDTGRPGIDCSQQGCDCLEASSENSVFENEKTHLVDGGSGFSGIRKLEVFDLPIQSPQRVSSNFRYDHVVLELTLDTGEDPNACFDEGYKTNNGGIFYFPISHIESPGLVTCYVNAETGKYICPDISGIFEGGQTYFEHPFVQCVDNTDPNGNSFISCNSPNLFVKDRGDDIVIKPYIFVGSSEKACLRITDDRKLISPINVPLPEGYNGLIQQKINLGPVTEEMLGGSGTATFISGEDNHASCGGNLDSVEFLERPDAGKDVSSKTIKFTYHPQTNGKYKLEFSGADLELTKGYGKSGNLLTLNGDEDLTVEEIRNAVFNNQGFSFKEIIEETGLREETTTCEFRVSRPSAFAGRADGVLRLKTELLKREGNSCYNAKDLLPRSALGLPVHTQVIKVQATFDEVAAASDIHKDFTAGRYQRVVDQAREIVNRRVRDLDDARAIYYWISSLIAEEGNGWDAAGSRVRGQIESLLDLFFEGKFVNENVGDYSPSLKNEGEFEKVQAYLCEVDAGLGGEHSSECPSVSSTTSVVPTTTPRTVPTTSTGDFSSCQITSSGNSESVGSPQSGTLKNGINLPNTNSLDPRRPKKNYGTLELVNLLEYASCYMKNKYGPELITHDLSAEKGGNIGHKSHRSGRDVDFGIYGFDGATYQNEYTSGNNAMCNRPRSNTNCYAKGNANYFVNSRFNKPKALEANWDFVKVLQQLYDIDLIILDKVLVDVLKEHVEKTHPGEWGQYGSVFLTGASGHHNHYHIRIKCPKDDLSCRNNNGAQAFATKDKVEP